MTARGHRWPYLASVAASLAVVGIYELHSTPRDDSSIGGSSGQVDASASNRRPRARWALRAPPPRVLPPTPPGTVRVSGRVVDIDTGEAVAGAEVVLAAATEHTATAERDGRFFVDVPPGGYRVFARGDRVLTVVRRGRDARAARSSVDRPGAAATVDLPTLQIDGPLDDVELDVVPGAIVRGVVRDRDGQVVSGAIVRARTDGSDDLQPVGGTDEAETDSDGAFELRVAARTQQLEATHPVYGIAANRPVVALDPGGEYHLELDLVPGCVIEGRVARPDGPLTGGVVERAAGSGDMAWSGVARFREDGRFRFVTDERATVLLRAGAWGAPSSEPKRFDCHDGARYRDVVFRTGSGTPTLAGTLRSRSGAAVPFAIIDITSRPTPDHASVERTDAEGRWAVHGLPPGEYEAVARVPGKGAATVRVTAPAEGVVMRLSGTGTIIGRAAGLTDGLLTLAVDCPHEGRAYGGTTERVVAEVRGGRFRADGVPACRASVLAERGPWRSSPVEVALAAGGTAQLDLDLDSVLGRDIFGRVVDAVGRPVPRAVVSIRAQTSAAATTDSDGRFHLRAPQGAILDISGAGQAVEVVVPAGSTEAWQVDVLLSR